MNLMILLASFSLLLLLTSLLLSQLCSVYSVLVLYLVLSCVVNHSRLEPLVNRKS